MKKQMILATLVALLSGSAWASKARMEALGQGDYSFYIQDSRNAFANPSSIMGMNNYVVTEWGSNPEGGFFKAQDGVAYGLYFGAEDMFNGDRGGYIAPEGSMHLFLAGEMDFQWGVRFDYAGNKDASNEYSGMNVQAGMTMGEIQAYVGYTLADKSKGGNADVSPDSEWEGMNMEAGAGYDMGMANLFGTFEKWGEKEAENQRISVGAATVKKMDSAMLFLDARFVMEEMDGQDSENSIPLTFGFESMANDWLTIRGSLTQNIAFGDFESNDTGLNAGASFSFGKVMVDGNLSGASNGNFGFSNVLSDVSVRYSF